MSATVVPTLAMFEQLELRVAELEARLTVAAEPQSPYMTVEEAAIYIGSGYRACDGYRGKRCAGDTCRRCGGTGQVVNRSRIDDLLSARRIPRTKDGARTLIRRADLDRYLDNNTRAGRAARPRGGESLTSVPDR